MGQEIVHAETQKYYTKFTTRRNDSPSTKQGKLAQLAQLAGFGYRCHPRLHGF